MFGLEERKIFVSEMRFSQSFFPNMQVVILCGGLGTRLREETEYRPKPMVPVGGRLRRAIPFIADDTFLFTYGDGLTNSDINGSIAFHKRHGAVATVTAVKPTGRFGELAMDGETITGFHEKPEDENGFISGGFFVLDKRVGDYLGEQDDCVLERQPMERLVKEGNLKAWCHDGFWQCMDTYREQELLNRMWMAGKAPWKIW